MSETFPHSAMGMADSPFQAAEILECQQARLAQLAERKALNLVVVGSSPTVGAMDSMQCRLTDPSSEHKV